MFWSRADLCIRQERGLALQKELCKQKHLLTQHSPDSSSTPGLWHLNKFTPGTATLWTWNTQAPPQQSFLCSTSQGTSMIAFLLSLGSKLPRHYTAFTQRQRALAPGSTWEGRGKEVPSALCQAQFTNPFHTRLMLLLAERRGIISTIRIMNRVPESSVENWSS